MCKGSCHCGAVKFEVLEPPEKLVSCNCSMCHRVGALWGHIDVSKVKIDASPAATINYVQGDRTLAFHTCKTCGCTTHWQILNRDGDYMAVNFRMCAPQDIAQFQIRKFDGADTWQFID